MYLINDTQIYNLFYYIPNKFTFIFKIFFDCKVTGGISFAPKATEVAPIAFRFYCFARCVCESKCGIRSTGTNSSWAKKILISMRSF